MKHLLLLLFAITFLSTTIITCQTIKVMTYNIRYDNPKDGYNSWNNRKEYLTDQIKFYEPDFLGTQEGLAHQITFIDSSISQYNYIGVGRNDGKDEGEFTAVFYNSIKFNLIENSTFWLSETPHVPSKGWDASLNRICTYGLFENIVTKKKLWVFNTHFDHKGVFARSKSARLIIDQINVLNKGRYPIIFMGDLNLEPENESIEYLSDELRDTKTATSKVVFGPIGTYNGFNFEKPVTRRIDYVFVSKENFEVLKYAVLSDSKDCRYPSDHLPVYTEIIIKK